MIPYRCWKCWHRTTYKKPIEQYRRIPRCKHCGGLSLFRPKDRARPVRARKEQCRCDAYHFPHCKGMGDCNPANVERKRTAWNERWNGWGGGVLRT